MHEIKDDIFAKLKLWVGECFKDDLKSIFDVVGFPNKLKDKSQGK